MSKILDKLKALSTKDLILKVILPAVLVVAIGTTLIVLSSHKNSGPNTKLVAAEDTTKPSGNDNNNNTDKSKDNTKSNSTNNPATGKPNDSKNNSGSTKTTSGSNNTSTSSSNSSSSTGTGSTAGASQATVVAKVDAPVANTENTAVENDIAKSEIGSLFTINSSATAIHRYVHQYRYQNSDLQGAFTDGTMPFDSTYSKITSKGKETYLKDLQNNVTFKIAAYKIVQFTTTSKDSNDIVAQIKQNQSLYLADYSVVTNGDTNTVTLWCYAANFIE